MRTLVRVTAMMLNKNPSFSQFTLAGNVAWSAF